jgi:hypothetical protein
MIYLSASSDIFKSILSTPPCIRKLAVDGHHSRIEASDDIAFA